MLVSLEEEGQWRGGVVQLGLLTPSEPTQPREDPS